MTAKNLISNGTCTNAIANGNLIIRTYVLDGSKFTMTECTTTNQFAVDGRL